MLSGGKRVAYARIPAVDVIYSEKDHERGLHCGTIQTLFMKVCLRRFEIQFSLIQYTVDNFMVCETN